MNRLRSTFTVALCLCSGILPCLPSAYGEQTWQEALAKMPLGASVTQLNPTNCVDILLRALESNQVVKALVFMPGATDELYMFRRAKADLATPSPTLLDAVNALTHQTLIRATFHPPLLLLHTDEDLLEPLINIQHEAIVDKLKQAPFVPHALYEDRDWGFVQPVLKKAFRIEVRPWAHSYDSWHFYRHSFAGWNLTAWEALEAAALAGKTSVTLRRKLNLVIPQDQVLFEPDTRARTAPKSDPSSR